MSNALATPSTKTRPRVVVLDDEVQLIELFEACLRDWFKDPEVLAFSNGNAAWDELSAREPDLVVMDCSHPGMGGIEILKHLADKKAKFWILLTSELFDADLKNFTSQGLNIGYLPKPFGILQFWRALNEHVGPSDFPERQEMILG